MWQAASGMRGLALKNACLDRFEVVWMETPARSIEFVLAGPLAAGQAMAAVTNYYLQGKPPASTVTVFDAQRNYPRALAGAAGKARWNDRQRRYEVVEYCEDETDWRNEIKLEEAEIVDDVRFTGCGSSSGTGGTNGTSAESSPGDATQAAAGTGSAGGQCGSIELRTAKAYFFEAPREPAWKNVLTFQEQAVLVAAAGSNNCLVFQEVTVCTPCVGAADTTRVCASVATTATCQCTCDCGDSGGYTPASGGGSNCSCSCQASSSINFG